MLFIRLYLHEASCDVIGTVSPRGSRGGKRLAVEDLKDITACAINLSHDEIRMNGMKTTGTKNHHE